MAKVFDSSGAIVDASNTAVLNDLTQAPIHESMPTGDAWVALVVPAEDGLKRVVLLDPTQLATAQSIEEIVEAVNQARQGLVNMANAKHEEQDAALDALAAEVAQIALTPGPQGERGLTGPKGADGSVGPKGDTGQQGLTGAQGAKGDKGDSGGIGPAGAIGPTGATGTTGPKGDTGVAGTVGATGAAGPKGDTGATGSQGIQGPKGDAGTPTRVERYVNSNTDANGIATITFTPAFTALPDCDIVESWTTDTAPKMICGSCYDVTLTGCKAQVMLSQGTLLIGATPFAKAGAGIKPIVRAIGK